MKAEEHAKVGVYHLEKAILIVLQEAKRNNEECIGPGKISERAGIFRVRTENFKSMSDAITTGILSKLLDAGKAERCTQNNGRGGWRLTKGEPD
ncbi:MAG: hypothetical protein OXK81_01785 [Chloroflexota bacterium]|nr:hypothetical protein [Chloroflexota bacterium]MDE2931525.1 hypothetical protein [Chloroflexota bacterium]